QFLTYWRQHFNDFLDTDIGETAPYGDSDETRWPSDSPLGSIVHWDMKAFWGDAGKLDDGSVLLGSASPQRWIFSTVWTPDDEWHPVSGNREFGYVEDADGGYTFYTRGADRLSGVLDLGVNGTTGLIARMWHRYIARDQIDRPGTTFYSADL